MKNHALLIVSAAALLTACGPGEPTPEEIAMANQSGSEAADPMPDETSPAPEATSPSETYPEPDESSTGLNIEAALAKPAADGKWFEQPNWTGFGPPASEAVFTIRCGDYGMVNLTRMVDVDPNAPVPGAIAAGDQVEEGYWTGEDDAEIPAAHFETFSDTPIFEQMASADKFAVLVEGQPDLVLPGSAAIKARTEGCRENEIR